MQLFSLPEKLFMIFFDFPSTPSEKKQSAFRVGGHIKKKIIEDVKISFASMNSYYKLSEKA